MKKRVQTKDTIAKIKNAIGIQVKIINIKKEIIIFSSNVKADKYLGVSNSNIVYVIRQIMIK